MRSRWPVVAGLGTDVAGARAAIDLAQTIGASIDHMHASAWLASDDVMRRSGWIATTPLQGRSRADTVLLVGGGIREAWPEIASGLALHTPPTLGRSGARRVIHLCPDAGGLVQGATATGTGDVLRSLSCLRALVGGRRVLRDAYAVGREASPAGLAQTLRGAAFGLAVWAPCLPTLAVEVLCGLIDDLNQTTRFAGLPLATNDGGETVAQAAAWRTGFPPRTSFAGVAPAHDPWRYDTARMVADGEADTAVWVSACHPRPPPWDAAVPTIALVAPGTVFDAPPAAVLEVGQPGIDHDAMMFDQRLGGIAFVSAKAPRACLTVAAVLDALRGAMQTC